MTTTTQASARFDQRLNNLLENLIEKLDEDFEDEGRAVLDEQIQSVASHVIDRYRNDLESSHSAKQDFMQMSASKLRSQILNPLADFTARQFTSTLQEQQAAQNVNSIEADAVDVRRDMERELQDLQQQREALAQYIERSRFVLEQEEDLSS